MAHSSLTYGLPLVQENPFSTRPLEPGDLSKMVGREHILSTLQNYLNFRSLRRVLLVGPLGSGRTSLARCLSPFAGHTVTIHRISAQEPARSLLEQIYAQFIDGEPSQRWHDLVSGLVDATSGFKHKIPLIIIDVPPAEDSILNVALRDVFPVLERLNAMIIVVADLRQKQQLSHDISQHLETTILPPFQQEDVQHLVQQRLASVGVFDYAFSDEYASEVLERSDGYPASIITLLRNAIDHVRMNGGSTLPPPLQDTSAKILPRDEPNRLKDLMQDEQLSDDIETQELDELGFYVPNDRPNSTMYSAHDINTDELVEFSGSDIIDASQPWQERVQKQGNVNDPPAELFGFELDIDDLEAKKSNDEPLKPLPLPSKETQPPGSYVNTTMNNLGMFKGLGLRNRAIKDIANQPQDENINYEHAHLGSGTEFWKQHDLPSKPLDDEQDGASIIHDEVGFADTPTIEDLISSQPENNIASNHTQTDEMRMLLSLLQSIVGLPSAGRNDGFQVRSNELFERIRNLHQERPHELPFQAHMLTTLSSAEAYVIGIAGERPFSPSDQAILNHLDIKRSRLSQISNRLFRCGILSARTHGRTRQYELTQAARIQLDHMLAINEGEIE